MCDYAVTTTPAMLHSATKPRATLHSATKTRATLHSATKTRATLHSASGEFVLREEAVYPNGGRSLFYVLDKTALIVDEGICDRKPDEPPFDYSLITSKQNEYVARFDLVFRLLREDLEELNALLRKTDPQVTIEHQHVADRANRADASPLEMAFEEHFSNVYGAGSSRYLWREYGFTDAKGHVRYVDYVVQTRSGLIGIEENGVSYHHPQVIGIRRYRDQLLKQNSCAQLGMRLFRFSTEDCRFGERLEDDIASFFGKTAEDFVDAGLVVDRDFELYEHQEGALEEMARRREQGASCFLAVFPTASGKSQVVIEDLARFAPTRPGFRALIAAPSTAIVNDWKARIDAQLPQFSSRILVCTYGYISRHYAEFAPDHFDYVVIDEAHHAVAPALKRTIQHFAPGFLVGLTTTDQRPDKKRLEEVFGSYRVGLSLADAMEQGIVARANAFRIETNVITSQVSGLKWMAFGSGWNAFPRSTRCRSQTSTRDT